MEPITGYGCNTFWNGQSAERIQLQSLCSVWTSGNAVVLSSPVYGFHKYGSQSKRYQQKIFLVVLWICPLTSLFVCSTIYMYNAGYQLNVQYLCVILVGILYLILGNFIPKIKPNYSIGFRVPWALCDSENWYHTHRFGGKCMVIGGIVLIATSPFQNVWILLVLAIIPCILPVIYSYLYYRKVID